MSDKWREWVTERTEDRYSVKIVDSTIRVMRALSEGKTPREAKKVMASGISETIAYSTAVAVAYFHPRGIAFSRYWNEQAARASAREESLQCSSIQSWC